MLLILLLEEKKICVTKYSRNIGEGRAGRLFVLMFFFVNGTYMRVFTKESQGTIYFLYILVLEFSHKKFRSRDSLQKFYFLKG